VINNSDALLAGLRVVDLSRNAAGARVSGFFADYGADVIFIEPPGGSPLREDPGWPHLGRGKRSWVADLRDSGDLERLRGLIDGVDVVVDTYRPGVLDRMELGYDSLARRNPRLVSTSITGFGSKGPWANLKGYEGIVMAKLGCFESYRSGTTRPGPTFAMVQTLSYTAAHLGIQGTLAALFERETSGSGQHVETSLVQGQALMDPWIWNQEAVSDVFPDAFLKQDAFGDDGTPNAYSSFTLLMAMSRDGYWLQFAQNAPHLFAALARALGVDDVLRTPGWTGLPQFDDPADRRRLWDRMLAASRSMSYAEWEAVFDRDRDVFAELLRRGPEVLRHPQLVEGGWVSVSEDPDYGTVVQPSRVVRVRGDVWDASPAPRLDEHAAELTPARSPSAGPTSVTASVGDLPLAGVTIVDLAMMFAAPYATSMLSELGARVIHIERLEGDPIRFLGGFPEVGGIKVMQGKESIAINLHSEQGREIVLRLIARSDAVLQGFRAGAAAKLGLDGDTLRSNFPDLVYLDATGYGMRGPYCDRPAYANSIAAAAGVVLRNAASGLEESDYPDLDLEDVKRQARMLATFTTSRAANADGVSAVTNASAIMMGLLGKRRGRAAHLETTMLSSTSTLVYDDVISYQGKVSIEPDPDLFGIGALYRLYESAAGWLFLACVTDSEWTALTNALRPYYDFDADSRLATRELRDKHDCELAEVLSEVFARRPALEWEADLTQVDVACVVSETKYPDRILMGEASREAGYVTTAAHPMFGELPRVALLIRFSRSDTTVGTSTLAGQHTDDILTELGYSADQVKALRDAQVVG